MPTFDLPWPPSVNHYWRTWKNRHLISKEGRAYRTTVAGLLSPCPLAGRLSVAVQAFPPDRRVRDLDNLLKSLLDALQHAGVYGDDSQIDRILIERGEVDKPGWVRVNVDNFGGEK